jgi:Ser-tRNA(Ala) deacylase AlaX
VEGNNVLLTQSCFYPESGGQVGDSGFINGKRVVDTKFDTEKDIMHIMQEMATFTVGEEISGDIDWERRYKIKMLCGGTHPFNTKEIGKVTLKRESGGKSKEKIKTFCFKKNNR